MAGMGPPPKHPSLRSRPRRVATSANLPAGKPFAAGPLPARFDAEGEIQVWHERTVTWWERVWDSPMAGEYLHSDLDGLLRLAELVDLFNWSPSAGGAAEIRLQEQRFGLSPIDRRRLQWEVDRAEEAEARREKRRGRVSAPKGKARVDPRKVLAFGGKKR